MQGRLQALSIQTYALFDKKDEVLLEFEVKNKKKRKKLDSFQGEIVTVDEIESLLK